MMKALGKLMEKHVKKHIRKKSVLVSTAIAIEQRLNIEMGTIPPTLAFQWPVTICLPTYYFQALENKNLLLVETGDRAAIIDAGDGFTE
jgi:prolyl-tRNA editing enzyme YbaK/EbsC (Cys-tRNA(Pro) deacylase)